MNAILSQQPTCSSPGRVSTTLIATMGKPCLTRCALLLITVSRTVNYADCHDGPNPTVPSVAVRNLAHNILPCDHHVLSTWSTPMTRGALTYFCRTNNVVLRDCQSCRISWPYKDAQDRWLWKDNTCPARTYGYHELAAHVHIVNMVLLVVVPDRQYDQSPTTASLQGMWNGFYVVLRFDTCCGCAEV